MRIFLYLLIVLFIANVNALVDHFWHPSIPYFHSEHLIVGGITGTVTAVLMGILFMYTKRLKKSLLQRKISEQQILMEKNKLETVLSNLNSGVTIRNRDYELIYQNEYVKDLFGDRIGEKCYRAFHDIDHVCDGCPVEKSYKDGNPHTAVKTVVPPSGETTFWENVAIPIRNSSGEIDSCLEINSNITERKQLEKAIFQIEEREQRRIGQDIHDDLGQLLTGITFKVQALQNRIDKNLPVISGDMQEIVAYLNDAKERTRLLSRSLMSISIEGDSLIDALINLAANTRKLYRISCTVDYEESLRIYNEISSAHLYRIAQESITNAINHGKSDRIEISLHRKDGRIEMKIRDNGRGSPDLSKSGNGMGLRIMQYRADIINASLTVRSEPGEGTVVTCLFTDRIPAAPIT